MYMLRRRVIILVLLFGRLCDPQNETGLSSRQLLFKHILQGYDNAEVPQAGQNATQVTLSLRVDAMYDMSDVTMDYVMRCRLSQTWRDPRLKFVQEDHGNLTHLTLKAGEVTHIWIPVVTIPMEKDTEALNPVGMSDTNTRVHVYSDGLVSYARIITVKLRCPFNSQRYPLDEHTCHFTIRASRDSVLEWQYIWGQVPTRIIPDGINLDSFNLTHATAYDCPHTKFTQVPTCHGVSFSFKRGISYFVLQLYLPSTLAVMASWINCWIDMDVGNQMAMSLLLILTIRTLNSGAQTSLPKVSYIKAIDVWFIGCLVLVCLSLFESALFSYVSKPSEENHHQMSDGLNKPNKISAGDAEDERNKEKCFYEKKRESKKNKVVKLHKMSRVLLPALFVMFNMAYWIYYL